MAYVRIPTGRKEITVTLNRKSLILYYCSQCGRPAIHQHILSAEETREYHVLQSQATKKRVEEEATAAAQRKLNWKDMEILQRINRKHDYSDIGEQVVCPHCKAVQPWSERPQGWSEIGLILLMVFIFAPLIAALISESLMMRLVCIAVSILSAAIAVIRYLNQIKTEKNLQNKSFIPPEYYNASNLEELKEKMRTIIPQWDEETTEEQQSGEAAGEETGQMVEDAADTWR